MRAQWAHFGLPVALRLPCWAQANICLKPRWWLPKTLESLPSNVFNAKFDTVLKGAVPASAMCPAHCAKVAPSIWHLETRRRSSLKSLMTIQLWCEPLSNKILKCSCSCNFVELHHVKFQRTTRSHLKAHQQEATPGQLLQCTTLKTAQRQCDLCFDLKF